MSMRINTNIEALNAQRNLSVTAAKYASSVEKLSSGLRINRAADDAAGLAISEKLNAQVTGLNQAQRNAQDGVSMVQTAEGALTEVHSMLQRIRELAVEAANSTVGTSDATSINAEVTALQAEINRISGHTTFNGQYLLTGALTVTAAATSTAKVGVALATTPATISAVDVSAAKANTVYTLNSSGGAGTLTLADASGNSQTINLTNIPASGTEVLNFGTMGVSITVVGAAAGTAAHLTADMTGLHVDTGAGSAGAVFQIGANENDTLGVNFQNAQTSTQLNTAISNFTTAIGTTGFVAAAGALITAADTEIGTVSGIRGNFGAVENRLQHTVASISVASENLNASESRIKDQDVASEMDNFTKTQILTQAGTAILAQANQAPQNILTLLR